MTNETLMTILIFGDIMGRVGRRALASVIPDLKKKYAPDLIIANGENLAHGKGMTEKTVEEVFAVENACEDSPHNRFLIPSNRMRQVDRRARTQGMEILGFFHSHPDAQSRPSAFDLEHAWPWYSIMVLSVIIGNKRKGR